jgi:membrane-associated phospholipid phosphatase
VQLENGASRLYLGVHYGFDNLQGQLLGLWVADTILLKSDDPAAAGVRPKESHASARNLARTFLLRPDLYGYFGRDTKGLRAR